ncbi:MAG TPA: hypothetical protein PKK26_02305 [Candidatus Wallbacteria bacterium]|nr:hypothetical protein [Candidatus Wallbacteria bacterium]
MKKNVLILILFFITLLSAGCLNELKTESASTSAKGTNYISAAVSYDGAGMFYSRSFGESEANIYYRQFDKTEETAITNDSSENICVRGAAYDQYLIYSSKKSTGTMKLYKISSSNTTPVELLSAKNFNPMDATFSKNGQFIVFAAVDNSGSTEYSQICTCDINGGNFTTLTTSDSLKRNPTVSADNSTIMFQKKIDQHWGLCYIDATGVNKIEKEFLVESSFDSLYPEFLASGAKEFTTDEELLYVHGTVGTSVRIELAYLTSSSDKTYTFREGRVIKDFSNYNYYTQPAASIDGKTLLYFQKITSNSIFNIFKTNLYGYMPTQITY